MDAMPTKPETPLPMIEMAAAHSPEVV